MESLEHLEVTSPRLNRFHVDGSDTLKTLYVKSKRLQVLVIFITKSTHTSAYVICSVQDNAVQPKLVSGDLNV